MKFYKHKDRSLNVEITPLIDIVFLLVIFFVVTSKIETNQYLNLDLPKTKSFSSSITNNLQNIVLLESGILLINEKEFSITELERLLITIVENFDKSEVVVLSIESNVIHEWVISIMDALQQLEFQNVKIKTYTE